MEDVPVATGLDFDQMFRAEYPRLVGFGVAMSGSVEVARDLAQETMARAYVNLDALEAVDSPTAWLRRVMTNLLIDHHRRRGSERTALGRIGQPVDVEMAVGAESRFYELLSVLPDRQRAVVALYYAEDLSVGQVAETLDLAPGTVKALLWKARQRLERYLEETS